MGLFSCGVRNYLKDFGYGTIALPREGIKPLLMFVKNGGRLTPIGPLPGTFQPGAAPVPTPVRQRSAPVSGSKSRKIDLDVGLSILGTVIGAASGSSLGLKAAYKNTRKVDFEFGDVMEDIVNTTDLDSYLSNATIAGTAGNYIKRALEDDEVYVAVSTLDAKSISVAATGESNLGVGLEVPVIQQIVGGKIAVASGSADNSKITYSSLTTPLAFGLKVVRLVFDRGKYTTLKPVSPQEGGAPAPAAAAGPVMFGPGLRFEV
jgi:hypothetical protein